MRDHQFPGRSVVVAAEAMAATSQPLATQTAIDILRAGGNAMDAAIAASATLAVVEPYSTGIGGDCFLLYHENASGKLHGLNGSGRAPQAASVDQLRAQGFETMPDRGIYSVTVPGAIDAWCAASERFGKLDFDRLLQPAIHYAENGYPVAPIVAHNWARLVPLLEKSAEASRAFLPGGRAPAMGDLHLQPDLARSLAAIAEGGRDAFYRGPIAEEIARYCAAQGGWLTTDDLAAHESEWVEPISSVYRGHEVFEIPPNGQGITVLMALDIIARADVAALPRLGAEHIHLLSEAFRLAMAERDRHVADSAFYDIPVDTLLSDAFARAQYARIDMTRALDHPVESALPTHHDTVYLSVVDGERNACSFINSTFHSFGSGLVAGNTGINLQCRGGGFVLEDGHFNRLEGGKRPLHTIIPSMVYRDGQPVLCFGVMGGQYQAMGQTYVLSNWIDYGLDIQQALDAPRFMPYGGLLDVELGVPAASREALLKMGHRVVTEDPPWGGGQAIVIDQQRGILMGGSDPRKDGCAMGY